MKYSIDEVFSMIGEECLNIDHVHGTRESIEVEGFQVHRRSMRYATFYQKGTKCVCCGKEGAYFQLDPDRTGQSIETRRHFNLYAADGTLMTKDHILPKKWGGTDNIDNFQTMCEDCNRAKGSQYDYEIDGIIATRVKDENIVAHYLNLEKAIYAACTSIHIFNQGGKPSKIAKKVIDISTTIYRVLDTNTPAYGYYWRRGKFKVNGKSYEGDNGDIQQNNGTTEA